MEDITAYPVMKKRCKTCPFLLEEDPRNVGARQVANMVRERCTTTASQICHHPALSNKPQTHLCRGARDYQLVIFHRLKVIPQPTDKAWEDTWAKLKATRLTNRTSK